MLTRTAQPPQSHARCSFTRNAAAHTSARIAAEVERGCRPACASRPCQACEGTRGTIRKAHAGEAAPRAVHPTHASRGAGARCAGADEGGTTARPARWLCVQKRAPSGRAGAAGRVGHTESATSALLFAFAAHQPPSARNRGETPPPPPPWNAPFRAHWRWRAVEVRPGLRGALGRPAGRRKRSLPASPPVSRLAPRAGAPPRAAGLPGRRACIRRGSRAPLHGRCAARCGARKCRRCCGQLPDLRLIAAGQAGSGRAERVGRTTSSDQRRDGPHSSPRAVLRPRREAAESRREARRGLHKKREAAPWLPARQSRRLWPVASCAQRGRARASP